MGKQTNLSIKQRTEAALSLIRRGVPATKIARWFGISEPTLYRYRDLFLQGGKACRTAIPGVRLGCGVRIGFRVAGRFGSADRT